MGAIYRDPTSILRARDPQMGEGVQEQAFQGQAPQLTQHWSDVTHGLFETCVTSPGRPPSPIPAESQPWAGELGTLSLPTSNFISWRSVWCAPSPTENVVVTAARVQWDRSMNLSCPFLTLFTTLDRQKRIPGSLRAWQVHPHGEQRLLRIEEIMVGVGGSAHIHTLGGGGGQCGPELPGEGAQRRCD